MKIKVTANNNKGYKRNNNEDIILLATQFIRNKSVSEEIILPADGRLIIAVADGMGGYKAGEVASEKTVADLSHFFYNIPSRLSITEINKLFNNWIEGIHKKLIEESYANKQYEGMGTTLVALCIYEKKVFWINCGDSRLYRIRNKVLCRLTTDHSLREMTGNRKIPSNIIMNSIGGGKSAFLDMKDITGSVFPEDIYLLCSDGLTDLVADEELENLLISPSADILVTAALNKGGWDNISACTVQLH